MPDRMRRRGRESDDTALRPTERHCHLSRDPLGGRVVRHTDAHQSPSGVTKNYVRFPAGVFARRAESIGDFGESNLTLWGQ